ncbi:signal peptidase I [Allobranchiibius sp. GilTou38]|uniref:signal peptidase I n=1 Tax=Allobranchiibius sp. GilTou38 TaxID=2815210 RepID=UPI00326043F5
MTSDPGGRGRGPRRWLRPGTHAWKLPAGATRPQKVLGPLPGPAQPSTDGSDTTDAMRVGPVQDPADSPTLPQRRLGPLPQSASPVAADPADEPTLGLRLHRPPQPGPEPTADATATQIPRSDVPVPAATEEPVQEPAPAAPPRRTQRWLVAIRELVLVVVIAMLLSFVIKTFLLQPFWIPSESMEPALVPGDRVVVSKLTPGPFDLHRGDVVVFDDPDNWLGDEGSAPNPGPVQKLLEFVGLYPAGDNHLIKRVIGMPGDHVTCCDSAGKITINGVAITEPYLAAGTKPSLTRFDITVPAGRIWVMGDNRGDSGDSRYHDDGSGATGSVPIKDVTGRADAVVWPLDRITWLGNYSATFAKVPSH